MKWHGNKTMATTKLIWFIQTMSYQLSVHEARLDFGTSTERGGRIRLAMDQWNSAVVFSRARVIILMAAALSGKHACIT